MVKILMHGCNGKMGRMITEIVKNEEDAVIAAGVDKFTGIPNDYPVFEEITQCDVDVDVVIDFSNAGAVDELLDYCVKKSLPVVLCTTGLSDEQLKKVDECSEKIAVLKSANMSMGINLLLKLLKDAAKVLAPAGYDIELVEKHHNQKLDAPSGTALALADSINEAMGNEYEYVYDRSQVSGADTDHICNAAQLSGRCPHPYNIMVSPLDINRMIFQQLIHNKMRSRSSVINITDNMQMIHNQTLDQF